MNAGSSSSGLTAAGSIAIGRVTGGSRRSSTPQSFRKNGPAVLEFACAATAGVFACWNRAVRQEVSGR